MKPDWDELASLYEGDEDVLVADVDCTAEGKELCEQAGATSYPTMKTFRKGATRAGEIYKGGRGLKQLRKHVESLKRKRIPLWDRFAEKPESKIVLGIITFIIAFVMAQVMHLI